MVRLQTLAKDGTGSQKKICYNLILFKIFQKIALVLIKTIFLFFKKSNKKIVVYAHPHSGNDMLRNILSIINSGKRYSLKKRKKDKYGNREMLSIDFLKLNDSYLNHNDVICYHLPYNDKTKILCDFFSNNDYIEFVTIRDPRDILFSKYNRIMHRKNDPYSKLFRSINSKEKKLEILINNFMNKIDSDSLLKVHQDYINWKNKNVPIIKYEDLMGIAGLSSIDKKNIKIKEAAYLNQKNVINLIFKNLGLKISSLKFFLVRSIVYLTAIKGRVGSYKKVKNSEIDIFYKNFPSNVLKKYERI